VASNVDVGVYCLLWYGCGEGCGVWCMPLYFVAVLYFFDLYVFIILTSTLVLGINYFVIMTRPLHPIPVRKRTSSSCYMIETYNTHHHFPCD